MTKLSRRLQVKGPLDMKAPVSEPACYDWEEHFRKRSLVLLAVLSSADRFPRQMAGIGVRRRALML
jgi:hypothetical protein